MPCVSDDSAPAATLAVPFISCSRTDSAFALRLAGALAAAGRDPWIDTEDIPPSVAWEQRIRQAILDTDGVVFLLSKASAASPRCHDEIELAVEAGKRIIPIRLEDVPRDPVDPEIRKRNVDLPGVSLVGQPRLRGCRAVRCRSAFGLRRPASR
jgi:TIR domain